MTHQKTLLPRPLTKECSGEWENEPDFYQETLDDDMLLVIHRHPTLYHLCGYIILPMTHIISKEQIGQLSVHNGITFYSTVKGGENIGGLFRDFFYSPAETARKAIGFDCAHYDDLVPGIYVTNPHFIPGTYKNMSFVIKECKNLHKQIQDKVINRKTI